MRLQDVIAWFVYWLDVARGRACTPGHHDGAIVAGPRGPRLQCRICGRVTTGIDVSDLRPPRRTHAGDPGRHRMKSRPPTTNYPVAYGVVPGNRVTTIYVDGARWDAWEFPELRYWRPNREH